LVGALVTGTPMLGATVAEDAIGASGLGGIVDGIFEDGVVGGTGLPVAVAELKVAIVGIELASFEMVGVFSMVAGAADGRLMIGGVTIVPGKIVGPGGLFDAVIVVGLGVAELVESKSANDGWCACVGTPALDGADATLVVGPRVAPCVGLSLSPAKLSS
jgi:hypothetical protein